jgi:zinc transport system substrate-binding protein
MGREKYANRVNAMRLRCVLVVLAAASACLGAASPCPAGAADSQAKLKVFVSILPQAFFVERVGGTLVEVNVLVGPGQSPHVYEPTPKEMARLADANVYFSIGWPFERQLLAKARAANPNLRVVDMGEGVPLRWFTPAESAAEEEHETPEKGVRGLDNQGPQTPSKGEPDPHVWLNPRYAKILAANVCKALSAADPAHAAEHEKNLAALQADLDRLDGQLKETLAPLKGKEFFVYHPAFGYFADAYGLKQVPVEIEGKEPTARQLAALVDRAKNEGVRVIFVQPQFSPKSAQAVAQAIGGAVVPMDDLARDYIANLERMARAVKAAIEGEKK